MPDLAKCSPGRACLQKEKCLRYKMTPSFWQTYCDFSHQIELGKCPMFIDEAHR